MRVGLSSKWHFRKILKLAAIVLIIVLLAEIIRRVEINFLNNAEQFVKIQATQTINKCIAKSLSDIDTTSFQIFGEKAVITDTRAINLLKSNLSLEIQNSISDSINGTVEVPIGSVFKSSVFHSIGPDVPVSIRPSGFVTTDIDEEFISEGINQVRYSMYLKIYVDIRYTGLFLQSSTFVTTRIPVIENISLGHVPDYYGDMGILN